MNHLLIFFIVQAAIIALCAWVYVSVAKFSHQDAARPDAKGALGLKALRSTAVVRASVPAAASGAII